MAGGPVRELRRRYLSLGVGELVAAAVFGGAMAWAVGPRFSSGADRFACWAALLPLLVILVQAGIYWLTARARIGGGRIPGGVAAVYRWFRALDAVLLVAGLVAVVLWSRPTGAAAGLLSLAVWLFGLAEYVNYFAVRLAYPADRWLTEVARRRTPRLVKDLRGPTAAPRELTKSRTNAR